MDDELRELRDALLGRHPEALGPEDGDEAFDRHILLAARVHRAARLAQSSKHNDTQAWIHFFERYFPAGRNDPEVAKLLIADWRCYW